MKKEPMLIERWRLPARDGVRAKLIPILEIWHDPRVRSGGEFTVYIKYGTGEDDYGFSTFREAQDFASGWMEGYTWNTGAKRSPELVYRIGPF